MKLLTAARLVPIGKRGGGVRPIAVGDVLRRLAARCLFQAVLPQATTHLLPTQVGIQVSGAAEMVARTCQLWYDRRNRDELLLQVDIRNAFNSVSRVHLLREVSNHLPSLLPYAWSSYSFPNYLFGPGVHLTSDSGVQQGDVCGPLLFAVALHRVVTRLEALDLDINYWYLDDGTLCGSPSALEEVLSLLVAELSKMGLTLNLDDVSTPLTGTLLSQIPLISSADGIVVLGVPVGSPDFIHRQVGEVVQGMQTMLGRLPQLQPSFARFLLLRECLGPCKVNHLLRSLEFSHGLRLARETTSIVRGALDEILGSPCSDLQFQLACSNVRQGGMGLRSPMLTHIPAMLSSIFSFAQYQGCLPQYLSNNMQPALQVMQQQCTVPPEVLTLPRDADVPLASLDPSWSRQLWWQNIVNAAARRVWGNSRPSLRLQCLQQLNSARYSADLSDLVVIPVIGKPPFSSHGWSLMARMRLGIPLSSELGLCCPGIGLLC